MGVFFSKERNRFADEEEIHACAVLQMLEMMGLLNMILSVAFVLLLPGFALSYVLFPKKDEIDWIERITLSIVLSMVIIPGAMFCLNLIFVVKINTLNTLLTSFAVIVIAFVGFLERKNKFISRRVFRR
jgi:uncharacterized membrane protein